MKEKKEISEIEQMQLDAILLDTAYNNAWMILSGEITFQELISNQFKNGGEVIMAYDPEEGPTLVELENIIDFYISEENYQRCASLRDIMHIKYPESINQGIED
ncbi:MAG: hypothetical protein N2B06_02815 [Clostridium sp.]|jgi:hypothetical protein|tara:strand:- start:120 stop:431 length:312 start_codon:yes stop_codon:yes gene_type:complete